MLRQIYLLLLIWKTYFYIIRANENYIPDAMQLIYTEINKENKSWTYHVNQAALDVISSYMKDETFEIISTIGQARKGKSYTLSEIVQKMSGSNIRPFKSSDYNEPFTFGIWMYLLLKCKKKNNENQDKQISVGYDGKVAKELSYPCSLDNKAYIILDIQGSYTETDEEAMRYASIVTAVSSQTFLFLHEKLYKHDVDQIRHIQRIIKKINSEGFEFHLNDINLGAIIREPFDNEFNNVETGVNKDLSRYIHYFDGFNTFSTVQTLTHFKNKDYDKSIENIVKYIGKIKESRMKWSNNAKKLNHILNEIINQFNNNIDIHSICIMCVFESIVEWLPYSHWSECSKKCADEDGAGIMIRKRECITGNTEDCKKHIGGDAIEEKKCNTFKCEWLPYGEWGECDRPCKGGKQIRERGCSTGDVKDCILMFSGSNVQEQECNTQDCKWKEIRRKPCDAFFGEGEVRIYKMCESGNDNDCDGNNVEFEKCENLQGVYIGIVLAIIVSLICCIFLYCKCKQ